MKDFKEEEFVLEVEETTPPPPPKVTADNDTPPRLEVKNADAPFGYNEDGTVKAPYGFTQRGGKVKILPGRPTDKPGQPKVGGAVPLDDEGELLRELKQPPAQAPTSGYTAPQIETPLPPPPPPKPKVYISGSMLLFCMDFVIPGTIEKFYNMFGGSTISAADLKAFDQLSAKEREELTALADEVAKEMLANMTPMQQFMFYAGILYSSKLMLAPKTAKVRKVKQAKSE